MSWQERALNKLPNLNVVAFWWLEGSIMIDDVGLEECGIDVLDIPELKFPLHLLNPLQLTNQLLCKLNITDYDDYIWPGTGAFLIRETLGLKTRGLSVKAQRLGYKDPKAEVEEFKKPGGKIIVIDDVISSGQTAYEVFQKGKLGVADLACWIMQPPENSLLQCYRNIYASLLVRGRKGKVPINSFSTFLRKEEILLDYANRYSKDPIEFIEFFSWLKKEGIDV
jgi:hypothetical protein